VPGGYFSVAQIAHFVELGVSGSSTAYRRELDDHLQRLASGDAHILPREIDALDCGLLCQRGVQPEAAGAEEPQWR
jgi:hypothetical protein